MQRYVAFLRAVNLGGNRRVGSDALAASFEDAGVEDVACFRTSGNVVFSAADERGNPLTARIESALTDAFGFEIPVFLRSERQVRAIAGHEPFPPAAVEASKGKLQVSLLAARPAASARKRALALAGDEDRLAIRATELYWLPSGGTQRSALDQKAIAALLGPATMRTMGTIQAIVAKFFA